MEEHSSKSIWKTVLIVLAAFVVMILYVFVSSAAGSKHSKGITADMYGVDSLECVGEPVMKIYVWQRNDKDIETNTQYLGASSYFYDLVPLTLKPGERVSTEKDIFDMQYTAHNLITVEYDGEVFGEYEIKVLNQLSYSGSKEAVPGLQYSGSTGGKTGSAPRFVQEDSSFSGNKIVTLNIENMISGIMNEKFTGQDNITAARLLKEHDVDVNDYLTKEKLSDLYPDAPEELKDLYRYVFTTHVTIHAKHPTKADVIVATAVLEVRQISAWQGTNGEIRRMLDLAKCYEENHTEIVVESYEQSDMLAFE